MLSLGLHAYPKIGSEVDRRVGTCHLSGLVLEV